MEDLLFTWLGVVLGVAGSLVVGSLQIRRAKGFTAPAPGMPNPALDDSLADVMAAREAAHEAAERVRAAVAAYRAVRDGQAP